MDVTDIVDTKLAWIIDIANRIKTYFMSDSDELYQLVADGIKKHKAVAALQKIACDGCTFMIISPDPKQLFMDIIESIKISTSDKFRSDINPITILTKMVDHEYMLDVNGTRLCYGIKASIASKYLLKAIACKVLTTVNGYTDNVDADTGLLTNIEELDPQYEYSLIIGGRKHHRKIAHSERKKRNIRLEIISRIVEFVRASDTISKGIIFVNNVSECESSAMNMIYTEYKYKTAIVDYLKLLINKSYDDYKFKTFLHNDFNVPYDFRMIKHSCLLNHIDTKQPTYIANMYNIGMYAPVICYPLQKLNIAHPIVKLYLLYIDVFMLEHKTQKIAPSKHALSDKLQQTFDELTKFNQSSTWIGFYIDEAYDKIQYNMKSRSTDMMPITLIV